MNKEIKVINFKNLDVVEDINEVYDRSIDAFVCGGVEYPTYNVPRAGNIMYMAKGDKEYFGYTNLELSLRYILVLQQEIKEGRLNIKNLWLSVSAKENSYMGIFLNSDVNGIAKLLHKSIENLRDLPFSEQEISMYSRALTNFVSDIMTKKINTNKIITQIEEKIKENEPSLTVEENLENKPFVPGHENWYNGKCYRKLKELTKDFDISYGTLWKRMMDGMSIKDMIETPKGIRAKRK